MIDETAGISHSNSARSVALNTALQVALPPPAAPPELRAGVLAAIARQPIVDWQSQRRSLELQRRAAIAQLNRRYLRRSRDAVLVGALLSASLSSSVKPLAHALAPFFAHAAPMVAGFIALGIGVSCGAAILQDMFTGAGNVSAP